MAPSESLTESESEISLVDAHTQTEVDPLFESLPQLQPLDLKDQPEGTAAADDGEFIFVAAPTCRQLGVGLKLDRQKSTVKEIIFMNSEFRPNCQSGSGVWMGRRRTVRILFIILYISLSEPGLKAGNASEISGHFLSSKIK